MTAVDDVSFAIHSGETYGLLGTFCLALGVLAAMAATLLLSGTWLLRYSLQRAL